MCGPKFCSMQISQELRQLAQQQQEEEPQQAQQAPPDLDQLAASLAEAAMSEEMPDAAEGMRHMSQQFRQQGAQIYH